MDPTEYRNASRTMWEGLAAGREAWQSYINEVLAPVREWLVRALAPQRGETILELAAGTGETGFSAAVQIGSEGRLISSDISPQMVEAARRRGAELGLTNVEHRVVDAEKIDMDDDSIDAVVCSLGYMLMADTAAALRETRRVLRPGGRVAFSVWGPMERNPLVDVFAKVVERRQLPPLQSGAPGLFSMSQPDRTCELLQRSGFSEIHTEEVPVRSPFGSFDELLSFVRDTSPLVRVLRGLPDGEVDAMKAELSSGFAPYAAEGGYALPGLVLNTLAS